MDTLHKYIIVRVMLLLLFNYYTFGNDFSSNNSERNIQMYVDYKDISPDSPEYINDRDNWNTTLINRWAEGVCYDVSISDSIAFFGNGGILEIVDISNPENPVELSNILTPSSIRAVDISGDYAFLANYTSGLIIVDISNILDPFIVSYYETGSKAHDLVVEGSYVYVADEYDGLRIIDISDHTNPVEIWLL